MGLLEQLPLTLRAQVTAELDHLWNTKRMAEDAIVAKDATISSLRAQVAALTEALGKAEEALKEAESNMGWANSMIHEGVEFCTVREVLHSAQKDGLKASANICAALSLLSAARQAATGTGPEGRIRPEGPHSAALGGLGEGE